MSAMRELFDLPQEMARLPLDHRGYPVPEFVEWIDGKPDFRVIKTGWREACYRRKVCWLCGGRLGSRMWFVIGPMCSITKTTMEPPCHRLCAEFAVKNCPFLSKPMAKRNTRDMPAEGFADGITIERNPGVTVIWETKGYKPFREGEGWLIEVGEPIGFTAWREGRKATREELLESVRTGLPVLIDLAEREGDHAVHELEKRVAHWMKRIFNRWLPETSTTTAN